MMPLRVLPTDFDRGDDRISPCRMQGTLRDNIVIKHVPSFYSASQVVQWLSCMRYPVLYTESEISSGAFPSTPGNLEDLIRLHLLAFPWENTSMHYTQEHTVNVTPEGAFKRLVLERQGSYCFALNTLFLGMIRALGYRAYAGAARVNNTPDNLTNPIFTPLSHMVIFVQPSPNGNQTYLVDVGFGSTGPTRPILLSDAEDNIVMGTNPTEMHRLTRGPHPLSSTSCDVKIPSSLHGDRNDFVWNLQVRHSESHGPGGPETRIPWRVRYSFTENELFSIDIESNSHVMCTKRDPLGLLWNNVLCVKYALLHEASDLHPDSRSQVELASMQYSKEEKEKFLYRYILIGKDIKMHIAGNSVTIRTVSTELERIHALREVFGIQIPDEAQSHIIGRDAALH